MKRDMELIRKILVAMEDHPKAQGIVPLEIDGYSDYDVSYQIKLLADNGLVGTLAKVDRKYAFLVDDILR
jgi:hypothetical protein